MQKKEVIYSKGAVTSQDGTVIGYRQYGGGGAGVILLHGGMMGSQNFSKLATLLARTFTVYVPDRRGRGLSGPHGDYSLEKEGQDVQAIVTKTRADRIFGLSSGAVVTLHAAMTIPELKKVALYEPPLVPLGDPSLDWIARYEKDINSGNIAAAMVSVIKGTDNTLLFKILPGFVLVPFLKMAMKANDKEVSGDDVPISALIPTLHYDSLLLANSERLLERAGGIKADVLLMEGGKSMKYLKDAVGRLHEVLPGAKRIEFPGLGHSAADDSGKPEVIAEKLMTFFKD